MPNLLQGMTCPGYFLTDNGSHAKRDLTILMPDMSQVPEGWYWIGQQAIEGYGWDVNSVFCYSLVVRPTPGISESLLADVIGDLQYVWGMKDPNSFELSTAIVPDGYVALSDFFGGSTGKSGGPYGIPGGLANFKCVRKDLLIQTQLGIDAIWTDRGSGASDDGVVCILDNSSLSRDPFSPFNCLIAGNSYTDFPTRPNGFWRVDFSKIDFIG